MRVLFTFLGGLGHLEPLLPVARAVQAAGHEVAVACASGRVPLVEAAGFRGFSTSPSRPPGPVAPARDLTPLAPTDARAAEVEFADHFVAKGARRHATALQDVMRDWRPDVVVRDETDLGAVVAAEAAGVPVATVLVLASGMLVRPDLVGPPLAEIRAEHGLPPDPDLASLGRGLALSPFPPSFRSPASPVPLETRHSYRYGARARRTPAAGRPQVYVTLGTIFNSGSGDLFERLLAGVGRVDADVLVTVGRDLDPAAFGPQPAHVRVERFVPQAEVLARTDLVVSHGGSGSLMAALGHGIPSVLLPLGADQPHNALRAEELGVAVTLDAAHATPDDLAAAVGTALVDVRLAERAQAVAAEVDALPDVDTAVALLASLAAE